MRGHADAETLAAFREELLSRRKAARVSAHLAACSRCAALDAQLAEVSALLTRSTAPPMPDALTARIQAAIAAEAATRAATAADGAVAAGTAGASTGPRDGAARPSRRPGGPRRSWLALRVAAVTAAVVVVAGGGYGVARLLSGSPGLETPAGTGAPAAKRAAPAPGVSDGLRAGGSQATGGGSAPADRIVSSGIDYQPGRLKAQVSATLARFGGNAIAGPGPGPSGANRASGAVPPPSLLSPALPQARYGHWSSPVTAPPPAATCSPPPPFPGPVEAQPRNQGSLPDHFSRFPPSRRCRARATVVWQTAFVPGARPPLPGCPARLPQPAYVSPRLANTGIFRP